MSGRTGFAFGFRHGWRSLGIACAAGLGFGAAMGLSELTVFAGTGPSSQHALLNPPDWPLIAALVLADELLLRLIGLTALAWLLARFTALRDRAVHWTAILLTALVLWPLSARGYLLGLDWTVTVALREVLLHGGAGVLWGWLCWRHGWLAGLAGHLSAYVPLALLLG